MSKWQTSFSIFNVYPDETYCMEHPIVERIEKARKPDFGDILTKTLDSVK